MRGLCYNGLEREVALAVLPLRLLPDPVLRQRTRRVARIDGTLQALIQDMIETMRSVNGVGLAANQVGHNIRVCVIQIPEEGFMRVLINPEVLSRSGEREVEEGCLSLPGYRGLVKRSQRVRVRALDKKGKPFTITAEDDLLAQALEHETDHLNGLLYIDRLVRKDAIWKMEEPEPPPPAQPS